MMKSNKNIFFSIFIVLSLSSCNWLYLGVGDGLFKVHGQIQNPEIVDCTIELYDFKGKSQYYSHDTGRNITTSFVVAPYKKKYSVFIRCPGYKPYKTIVEYRESVSPSKPLQLGDITLQSND